MFMICIINPELLFIWETVPCDAPPRYKNIKKQFLVIITSSFGTCSEIDPSINLVSSNYEHQAHTPQFHSECVIAKGYTPMEQFVGLQTVVTLLCWFEKKCEGNNKKNLKFQQIRVISNSGIFKYIFVSYFSL